jgi:hypothetical protein
MPFRSLSVFARSPEPDSSGVSVRRTALGMAASLFLSGVASAAVTIRAVEPYSKVGDVVYLSVSGVEVDAGAGFHAFDLASTSDPGELVYFDVSTNRAFAGLTPGTNIVVTLVASDDPIPIARAGEPGAVADCSAGIRCQGIGANGLFYAAKFPVSNSGVGGTIRIGFYPKHVCEEANGLSGCSGASVSDPTNNNPTSLSLRVYISQEQEAAGIGRIAESEERANVSLNFQNATPQKGSCPSVSQFYFPGDQQISFNGGAFSNTFSVTTGAAPVDTLIFLAKDGAPPGSIGSADQINERVPFNSASVIGGFVNTTTGADHQYQVTVQARDRSGAISTACSDPSYIVQGSTIQGLLKESQCFIATAAFRSGKDPAVLLLRDFRDSVLASSAIGRTMIRAYYRWSPAAAQMVLDNPSLRVPVLVALAPLQLWAWLTLHSKWIFAAFAIGMAMLLPRAMRRLSLFFAVAIMGSLMIDCSALAGEEESIIEQVRRESPASGPQVGESYTEQERKRLGPETEQESLIEVIRSRSGETGAGEQGYSEKKKRELPPVEDSGSAIEAVRAGRSGVVAKKAERQGSAFGLMVSVKQDRAVLADSSATYRTYSSMYGAGYVPDLQLFYETQPFHGELLGSIGLFGQFGFAWQSAYGTFEQVIANPDGGNFTATSGTEFTFVTLPASVGAVYRFNLLRFARPYIKAGGAIVGYAESRSDDRGTLWGNSRGYLVGAGVAFPLDFLDSVGSWSMYEAHGVRRNCLTIDYQRLETFSGALDFTISGFSLGLLFEL